MSAAYTQFRRILSTCGEDAARAFVRTVGCAAVFEAWVAEIQARSVTVN